MENILKDEKFDYMLSNPPFGVDWKKSQKAIKEAYISAHNTKYILLCGDSFRVEAQNSLLKLLEEPPKNITKENK